MLGQRSDYGSHKAGLVSGAKFSFDCRSGGDQLGLNPFNVTRLKAHWHYLSVRDLGSYPRRPKAEPDHSLSAFFLPAGLNIVLSLPLSEMLLVFRKQHHTPKQMRRRAQGGVGCCGCGANTPCRSPAMHMMQRPKRLTRIPCCVEMCAVMDRSLFRQSFWHIP